ncbi:hypothetical protein AJ78_02214 [Emergomyces pasteurianus Ep9510]|uniref:Uncharacterized protein n=1 Tax=Emergomyces pasteurianus Ep9510 TaxID=1447872 RepID=A0A1J9PMM5_9EURO|nr:hypothetical protein AJ78_02214 [Emergomyces pasteurianus Ep9510]
MNAYYQWAPPAMKTFFLCGASKEERLYAVQVDAGYSNKTILGTRPGLVLHNGKSSKDPILAAAGEDSQQATSTNYAVEIMRGAVTDEQIAAFHFAIEVGSDGKMIREEFEWRKLKKGKDDAKGRGFRLVRLGPRGSQDDCRGIFSSASFPASGETLAVIEWAKGLSSLIHVFSLQLMCSGQSNALGERWTLMVVMTALRLWWLHVGGRANAVVLARGEQIHSNQSIP